MIAKRSTCQRVAKKNNKYNFHINLIRGYPMYFVMPEAYNFQPEKLECLPYSHSL